MTNPTEVITQALGTEPYKEGDYFAFNSGGVETAVGEFLFGLIKIVRPERVCETGTHKGISTAYMGLALKENQKGNLETIEFDQQWWKEAEELWRKLEIEKYVYLHKMKVEEYLKLQAKENTFWYKIKF